MSCMFILEDDGLMVMMDISLYYLMILMDFGL